MATQSSKDITPEVHYSIEDGPSTDRLLHWCLHYLQTVTITISPPSGYGKARVGFPVEIRVTGVDAEPCASTDQYNWTFRGFMVNGPFCEGSINCRIRKGFVTFHDHDCRKN